MSALQALTQPAWRDLTLALLHFLWQGALVAGLVRCVLAFVSRRSANVRYAVTLIGLVSMAACPVATLALLRATPLAAIPSPVGADFTSEIEQPVPIAEARPSFIFELLSSVRIFESDSLPPTVHLSIIIAWFAGIACFGVRLVFGSIGAARMRTGCRPVEGPLQRSFEQLVDLLKASRRVRLRVTDRAGEALVLGFVRPVVLLPAAWLAEMPVAVLEAVLAHELAHIRRRDVWVNLMQRVLETLLFYHPAVWWLSRQARIEREKCCDELAVAATSNPLAYVQALELAARQRLSSSQPVVTAAFTGTHSMTLLERVRNVLGLTPRESKLSWWPVGIAALILPLVAWAASAGWIGGTSLGVASADEEAQEQLDETVEISLRFQDDEEDEESDDEQFDDDEEGDDDEENEGEDEEDDEDESDEEEYEDEDEADDESESDEEEDEEDEEEEAEIEEEVEDDWEAEEEEEEEGDSDEEGDVEAEEQDELAADELRELARAREQLKEEVRWYERRRREETEVQRKAKQAAPRKQADASSKELYRLVEELRADLASLRNEVAELRNQRQAEAKKPGRRKERAKGVQPEGDGARQRWDLERSADAELMAKALVERLEKLMRDQQDQAVAAQQRAHAERRRAEQMLRAQAHAAQRAEAQQREAAQQQAEEARRQEQLAREAAERAAEIEAKERPDQPSEEGVRP